MPDLRKRPLAPKVHRITPRKRGLALCRLWDDYFKAMVGPLRNWLSIPVPSVRHLM